MIDVRPEEAEELLPVPDTGSLRYDLITYITSLAAYLNTPRATTSIERSPPTATTRQPAAPANSTGTATTRAPAKSSHAPSTTANYPTPPTPSHRRNARRTVTFHNRGHPRTARHRPTHATRRPTPPGTHHTPTRHPPRTGALTSETTHRYTPRRRARAPSPTNCSSMDTAQPPSSMAILLTSGCRRSSGATRPGKYSNMPFRPVLRTPPDRFGIRLIRH
ncbi:hypothetical protein SAMN04490220_8645 [Rhodococcus jostii]|uniref:Uncharacterized protein n=1 Tax=Rhodococcus jostii TaxID=132919 RepID=A0A1H5M413_RHOJO|nr:hypothetical protein SAMN04490220_8645 [Rhodococcus jostii]